jgi:hypothetical protein
MSGYLSLNIPVFLNGFNNHFVPFLSAAQYAFFKYFIQVWSIHITVALRYDLIMRAIACYRKNTTTGSDAIIDNKTFKLFHFSKYLVIANKSSSSTRDR